MKVTEIWRYPVKTMAGEKLQRVRLGPLGVEGDRIVHVEDGHGRVITSRSHPRFLGHQGTLGPDGEPLVDGLPWQSSEVAAEVVDIVGPGAKLVRYDGVERFDVLPLLVRTDGAVAAFGHRASTLTTQPLDRWRRELSRARLAWLLPAHWPGAHRCPGSASALHHDVIRSRHANPGQEHYPRHLPAFRRQARAQLFRDRRRRHQRRGRGATGAWSCLRCVRGGRALRRVTPHHDRGQRLILLCQVYLNFSNPAV